MADRKLTDQEKRLWSLYTKDIKPRTADLDWTPPEKQPHEFKIKAPKKSNFKSAQKAKLSNHETLENKDSNWGRKLSQGKAKVDGKIDLHGLTCSEAHEKLYGYLERAQVKGKRIILVVTGKGGPKTKLEDFSFGDFERGRGVLRREVPMWLSGGMRHMVVSYQQARRIPSRFGLG